jgi:HAD superfamily hydrolase (TIGR01662 family)
MSYNMWGAGKTAPQQQRGSEDEGLSFSEKMAKYHKPLVAFDRDGVMFKTTGEPITRETAEPIIDSFKAVAMIRRKGYKIAMICDQPFISAGLITHEQAEDVNKLTIELLGRWNCPSIDMMLYNESNQKHDIFAKPNTGMFKRLKEEFMIPYKGGWYVGDQVVDAKMAMKARMRPILLRTGLLDDKKMNSFANKQLKRQTKVYDNFLEFAETLI